MTLDDLDKKIIALIQGDLPLAKEPFALLAQELGISEKLLLERIEELKTRRIIRRFGAVLRHQKAGFKANAMIAWRVPDEKIEAAGTLMAKFKEVTHCYQRVTHPDWPYNLYTMVHSRTRAECRRIAQELSRATGIKDYQVLFTEKEFKKTSMIYF